MNTCASAVIRSWSWRSSAASDLDHPTLEIRLVSLRDVVAHHDIAVRRALATAEPQVPPAVVERLRFDRHDADLLLGPYRRRVDAAASAPATTVVSGAVD